MKKKITAFVLLLALLLTLPAFAAGTESVARKQISGVIELSDGTLLVTDVFNKVIWQLDGERFTRFAGTIGVAGVSGEPVGVYHDGAADRAFFKEPWDIAPFLDGYAVSDADANVIRYVAGGRVQTLAGNEKAGSADGEAKDATFNRPTGLAVDSTGTLYVSDTGNGTIRSITRSGKVATVASGLVEPTGLCWNDGVLYVAETGRCRICRIADGKVEAVAGVSEAAGNDGYDGGYVDGSVANARFDHPQDVAVGADGTIYVADTNNAAVRAIANDTVYTVVRGSAQTSMPTNPRGMSLQGDTLRVADWFAGNVLTVSVAPRSYRDVPANAWFADAVAAAMRYGIASGVSDTEFAPNGTMNRGMFVTMLSRLHLVTDGNVIINGDASFSDVETDTWYSESVRWAADNDIVRGEDGAFAPLRSISRQELATMLYRYGTKMGMQTTSSADALSAFSDASNTASWALDAMRWACSNGILRGDGEGNLNPAAPATRAQALTMLLNFMNAYSL